MSSIIKHIELFFLNFRNKIQKKYDIAIDLIAF